MLEDIRVYLMQRVVAMHNIAVNLEDQITPNVKKKLEYLKRYSAFRRHFKEMHVTWAHLEKKQTRLQTYTNISQDYVHSSWRRRHRLHVTPSHFIPKRRHKISRRRQNARPSPLSRIFYS
ncbi:hypothetical protein Tco_0564798 [Tanacetum coccineum]